MSSLTYFFGETTNLNYDSCYAQLTPCGLLCEGTISIVNLLSFRSTLTPAEPSQFPFSSVVMSLLSSGDGYLNHDLLSNHKYASLSFRTSPYTIQTEVLTWNTGLNFTDILSTFNSTTMMNASAHRTGLPPDISPTDHYCSDNTLALAMYSTSEFNISFFVNSLEIGLLLRSSSIPEASLYPSLSSPVELATSFGLFNILLTKKLLPDKASTEGTNISENAAESFLTIPQTYRLLVTKDKSSALTRTNKATVLWGKQPHLIYVSKSSAPILSSKFHSEENLHSSEVLLLIWPTEVADTPKLCFSTNEFDSYDSSIIRTHVAYPDALQLDESDLSLDSPLGTKMNFQMTRKLTSKLLEESTVTFHKEIPTERGFYATTLYYGAQGQTNTSPRVVHAIQWVTATIGHKFSFSVPSDTFYDQEDGNTTQLTLGINPVAGPPTGQESWLQFNSDDQTMYGYPLANDFQYSPQEFLLFATDSGGLRTSSILTIEILRPTTIPCHIYTIRTKNSYHSFLRDRERINLFFEKLSKYLTAGDIGNLVLLQLEPGSTVITWYSKSFCTGNKCAIPEIQGVLLKLGAPGGNANLDFVEAMLPDYRIVQTEDVAYGGICLPTTKPLNESVTSNKPLATFMDNLWIRNISAFLISICITIMVILIAAFHYCKYHKKLFGLLSAPVQGKPFLNYIDLEMDMLKSRKSPKLEQEIPPSAQLWLPVPTPSHMYLCRPDRKLVASRLPPPPKYRLPPLYGKEQSRQTHNEL
ncbi:uncharacterized protein LOC123020057 [Varanus komodoensis]|uniref:uncharacterized protein LOC123020057 n=1 Tax=Varanus komodoensis TaxID=61221 RepID=UPI001CF7C0D3|nr:uncharacterized protein LOC123020057 [Varanus komodoensis]